MRLTQQDMLCALREFAESIDDKQLAFLETLTPEQLDVFQAMCDHSKHIFEANSGIPLICLTCNKILADVAV